MKYPKISVITPSYNQGVFLERTILSILNQNYPNLEYIVCDGGSTDNSIDIIKKYEDKITWWCSEKDSGQSNAINKGFKKATGDIVCWINSDDILLDGALDEYARLYNERKDCSVYLGQILRIDSEDNILFSHFVPKPYPLFYKNGIIRMSQQAWAWKREIFKKIGYINENRHACMDVEFLMRQLREGFKVAYTNRLLGAFRLYEGTKTSFMGKEGLDDIWTDDVRIMRIEFADFKYSNPSFWHYILYRIFKIVNGMSFRSWALTQKYKGKKYSDCIFK